MAQDLHTRKEKGTVKDNIQQEGPGLDTQPIKRNHKKGKDTYRKEKGHRIKNKKSAASVA